MRAWQFRQKTPGFGISKNFYLSVLAATAQLPRIRDVVDPKGLGGAPEGFGAPLAQGATKDDLDRPMERGIYALASKSRQTILRMMVMPKEEAGFDPVPFLRSKEAQGLSPELLARISATWTLLQLTFETHEAMVYGSLKFLLLVADKLAALTEGVVSDPISRVYLLPGHIYHPMSDNQMVNAADFVRVHYRESDGWTYTLGLQKFVLPELEIFGVSETLRPVADRFLTGIAQSVLTGKLLEPGRFLGSKRAPFQIGVGGLDRANWEGIECFELLPPSGGNANDSLASWSREAGQS